MVMMIVMMIMTMVMIMVTTTATIIMMTILMQIKQTHFSLIQTGPNNLAICAENEF